MTGRVRLGNERRLAFVVLSAGVLASFWMQREAAGVDAIVAARSQQLTHLRTVSDPRRTPHRDGCTGDALRGVFADYRIRWIDTPFGPTLGLAQVTEPQS